MIYPCKCELCGHIIESEDDAMWWHGYGNCAEITDEMWAEWERESKEDFSVKKPLVTPWKMPRWMYAYLPYFVNTGGNGIEELYNGNTDPRINLPLSTIQFGVKSQVLMLNQLHERGLLK